MECLVNMSLEDKNLIEAIEGKIAEIQERLKVLEVDLETKNYFKESIASLKSCSDYLNKKTVAIYEKYLRTMNSNDLKQVGVVKNIYEKAYQTLTKNTNNIELNYQRSIENLKQSERYVNGHLTEEAKKALSKACEYQKGLEVSDNGKLAIKDICYLFLQNAKLRQKYLEGLENKEQAKDIQKAVEVYEFYMENTIVFDKEQLSRLLKSKANKFYNLACSSLQKGIERTILSELDGYQFPKSVIEIIRDMKTNGVFSQIANLENAIQASKSLDEEENKLNDQYQTSKQDETREAARYISALENPNVLKKEAINFFANERGVTRAPYVADLNEEKLMLEFTKRAKEDPNFIANIEGSFEQMKKLFSQMETMNSFENDFRNWQKEYQEKTIQSGAQIADENVRYKITSIRKELRELSAQLGELESKSLELISSKRKKRKENAETPVLETKRSRKKTSKNTSNSDEKTGLIVTGKRLIVKAKNWYKQVALELCQKRKESKKKNIQEFLMEEKIYSSDITGSKEENLETPYEAQIRKAKHLIKKLKLGLSAEKIMRLQYNFNLIQELEAKIAAKQTELYQEQNKIEPNDRSIRFDEKDNLFKKNTFESNDPDFETVDLDLYDTGRIQQSRVNTLDNFIQLNNKLKNSSFLDVSPEIASTYHKTVESKVDTFKNIAENLSKESLTQWGAEVTKTYMAWKKSTNNKLRELEKQIFTNPHPFVIYLLDMFDYRNKNSMEKEAVINRIVWLIQKFKEIGEEQDILAMAPKEIVTIQALYSRNQLSNNGRSRNRELPNQNLYRTAI